MTDDAQAAWGAVSAALPAGWTVERPSRVEAAPGGPWVVVAANPRAQPKHRRYVRASGATEAAALRYLAERLRRETPTTGGTAGGLDRSTTIP